MFCVVLPVLSLAVLRCCGGHGYTSKATLNAFGFFNPVCAVCTVHVVYFLCKVSSTINRPSSFSIIVSIDAVLNGLLQ